MADKYTREMLNLIRSIQNIDYIPPEDIPNIDLYMDQITTFMDEHLKSSKRFDEDKILTKTMINNYTKNALLPASNKKKYSKEHMILLIFIYYFKNFLTISDIKSILTPITDRFFENKDGLNLDDIYQEVFNIQLENIDSQVRDVIRKLKKANGAFSDIEDEKERNELTQFTFICMLSFDIWIKKTIIENIVDKKIEPSDSAKKKEKPKKK
ncbi:MAG: DUF1836 domain-containing protein [Butyribacter sp.]|nr:DUF1836 domain-containing protein [bacterium]MDY3853438.1 DUF1836 domain-containing protein [Butyribacter sp.]